MKIVNKTMIGLVSAILLLSGCANDGAKTPQKAEVKKLYSEESLGLRKTDIYTENATVASKTEYNTAQPMTSARIKRAFQDAPPMIPHDTTGLLPIKAGDNRCLSCHLPEIAAGVGATPIPVSHFTDFRPRAKIENGVAVKTADDYKNETHIVKTDHLQNARFNCSACHAPQSQGNLAVENTFEPSYVSPDGANRSHWDESKYTKSLNTVIGGESYVTKDDVANKNSKAGHLEGNSH